MRIAIYNSNTEQIKQIQTIINKTQQEFEITFEVKAFADVKAVLNSEWSFDMAILNVDDKKDLQLAKKLCNADSRLIIIFVSSNLKYLDNAFELEAFRFFTKPIDENRFTQALVKAEHKTKFKADHTYIRNGNTFTKVYFDDIVFIEISNRRTIVTTKNSCIISKQNMVFWREILSTSNFATPHNSFLVNLEYITLYKKRQYVVLNNNYIIDISRTKSGSFDTDYQKYIKSKPVFTH